MDFRSCCFWIQNPLISHGVKASHTGVHRAPSTQPLFSPVRPVSSHLFLAPWLQHPGLLAFSGHGRCTSSGSLLFLLPVKLFPRCIHGPLLAFSDLYSNVTFSVSPFLAPLFKMLTLHFLFFLYFSPLYICLIPNILSFFFLNKNFCVGEMQIPG